ncbi:MAG: tetratricopeptide repeat protein [Prevotella sp.]|nr:tetratricopeptide repeat protein [Prevotella sp.]
MYEMSDHKILPMTLFQRLFLCLLLLVAGVDVVVADITTQMDSVRSELKSLKGKERMKAWKALYYMAYETGDNGLSMRTLDEWIDDARQHGDAWSESVARQNKVVDYYNSAKYDSVRQTAQEAMDFCRDRKGLTRKYFEAWHLIICSYHAQGQYNTAIREGRLMHEEAIVKNDLFGQSMAYYNMGNVYYTMRHFLQSVDALEQSVRLLQREDSSESVLLEVYPYYGDALEARKDYQKLDEMTQEWAKHVEHFGKNKQNQLDMPPVYANYYIGRTQALLGLGRTGEARQALKEAEKYINDSTSFEYLYLLYYNAELARRDGRYDEALRLNTERLRLTHVIDDRPTLIPVHLQRADILYSAGRYKEAAEMYKQVYHLDDSMNTMQTREQLNEMNTFFQVDELKVQNEEQQDLYTMIIGVVVIIALLLFLIHRYIAARRLKQKNEELARSNAELQLANEKAQESSRMKTAFIRNISHEIRTPLNILNGFTQVLIDQEGQLSKAEKDDISQRMEENSKHMSELVNKMLEMSETTSSAVIERTEVVTASSIVEKAVEMSGITHTTAPGQPASPVSFAVQNEVAEELTIKTHSHYAQRALRHLLENARKFTRQGYVHLHVTADGQMVTFMVEDTGIGVPEEAREKIFGEFVKLDEYESGTGIGLPLARDIARKLGGDIVLDTTYTGGARFIMTLPIKDD